VVAQAGNKARASKQVAILIFILSSSVLAAEFLFDADGPYNYYILFLAGKYDFC
jgi:hypothetical protein